MYDIYEVPFYHNGTFVKNDTGHITGFRSENTGRLYKIKRVEPESLEYIAALHAEDSDFREHLYAEDITIVHEVSGDVDSDGYCKDVWLDGKHSTDYQLSACFKLALEDVVEQEYINGRDFD